MAYFIHCTVCSTMDRVKCRDEDLEQMHRTYKCGECEDYEHARYFMCRVCKHFGKCPRSEALEEECAKQLSDYKFRELINDRLEDYDPGPDYGAHVEAAIKAGKLVY